MIPTIETIVEDLIAGSITKQQAIEWLHQHALDAGRDLMDDFAMSAMPLVALGLRDTPKPEGVSLGQHAAMIAYTIAGRMMQERKRNTAARLRELGDERLGEGNG